MRVEFTRGMTESVGWMTVALLILKNVVSLLHIVHLSVCLCELYLFFVCLLTCLCNYKPVAGVESIEYKEKRYILSKNRVELFGDVILFVVNNL